MTLEDRRKYLDLVVVFKIVTGRYGTHYSHWFTLVGDGEMRATRAMQRPLNIIPQRHNLDIRSGFFSNSHQAVEHFTGGHKTSLYTTGI